MYKIECFKIRLSKCDNCNPFEIDRMQPIHNVRCDFPSIKLEPTTITADPFLFVYNDTLFLFYEKKTIYSKGRIVMECTKDLKTWSKPVTVLQEEFHLSYPFVFEENSHIYMIPETGATNAVRLYEADDQELSHFSFKCSLLVDQCHKEKAISFSDSSVFKHGKTYYLLTSYRNKSEQNITELYLADDLLGPYAKHDCSPIAIGNKYGRCAGCVITVNNELYRFSQDCEKRYGDNVSVLHIDEINREKYSESVFIDKLIPTSIRFYKEGGHQYNSAAFKGQLIIATDAKEYHYFLLNRMLHRFFCEMRKLLQHLR